MNKSRIVQNRKGARTRLKPKYSHWFLLELKPKFDNNNFIK